MSEPTSGAVPEPQPTPTGAAVKGPGFWESKVTGRVKGHGGFNLEGVKGAASQSWGEVKNIVGKDVTLGQRGVGFVRVGAVGLGAVVAAGALRSKDAEGNDRSALARLGNLVIGGGMVAGGVLAGGRA